MRLKRFCLLSFIFFSFASPEKIKTLYNSLDPTSLSEHIAFYELYPHSEEGHKALNHIGQLLSYSNVRLDLSYLSPIMHSLIQLVNKPEAENMPLISYDDLNRLEQIGSFLPNRKLKGNKASSEEEVLALPSSEIDLSRALFLSEWGPDEMQKIRSYESALDLMAIQILVRLPKDATIKDKVHAINHYIFSDQKFRFPPHSSYAKDIDLYTFLPSVLDSRRGVCLGVSILYISLAQRIGLELEMITPPGHIYVRAIDGDNIINIETTARGVNPDSNIYLGVDTLKLERRTIKEVVGMAHFNQASQFWQNDNPEKALISYHKALPYMPDDMLLKELMGYCFLFAGKIEEGEKYLSHVRGHVPYYALTSSSAPEDYLDRKVDVEGMKAVLKNVDENRSSIVEKKNEIIETLNKFPEFRQGWHYLAICYIQLHRLKEAVYALNEVHKLDPNDPETEYYLSALYLERLEYEKAWEHLIRAEKLTAAHDHYPKALIELRKELMNVYPKNY